MCQSLVHKQRLIARISDSIKEMSIMQSGSNNERIKEEKYLKSNEIINFFDFKPAQELKRY